MATRPALTWAVAAAKVQSVLALAMPTAVATAYASTVPASTIARTACTTPTSQMSTAVGSPVRPVFWAASVNGTRTVHPDSAISSGPEIGHAVETWAAAPRRPRVAVGRVA